MRISERGLTQTITGLAYATAVVPLVFSVYFYPSHVAPQTFLFRALVELMAVVYSVLWVSTGKFFPRFSPLSLALLAFLTVSFLSAFFGVDFYKSFFSDFDRHFGLLTIAHFVILFFILASVFTRETWHKLFAVSVLTSALSALYGLYQLFFADVGRIYGTIGNPAFFSAYLLVNVFFAVFLLTKQSRTRSSVLLWGGIAILNAVTTIATGTRGTFLALLVAVVVLGIGYFFSSASRKARRLTALCGIGAVAVVAGMFIFKDTALIQSNQTLSRLTHISAGDVTSKTRLLAWQGALESFREYPWLGVGPEHFNTVFNKNFKTEFYRYERGETQFDRAHNIFIEQLATTGTLGLLAYSAIFTAFLMALVRCVRLGSLTRMQGFIFGAFLAAYIVQGSFSMDTLTSWFALVFAFAYVERISQEEKTDQGRGRREVGVSPAVAVFCAVVLGAAALWSFNIKPALADLALSDAYALAENMATADPAVLNEEAVKAYENVFMKNTYASQTARSLSASLALTTYQTFGKQAGAAFEEKFLPFAFDAALVGMREQPYDYFARVHAARLYNIRFLLTRAEDAELEQELFSNELAPNRFEVPFLQAQLVLVKRDYDATIKLSDAAIEKSPDFPDFYHLAFLAYTIKGDDDRAFAYMTEGIERGFVLNNKKELLWLAHQYEVRGDSERAREFFEKADKLK